MIIQNFRNFTHSQLAYGFSDHHVTVQQLYQLAVILQNGTKQSNISELPNLAQSPIARLSPFDRLHPLRWQLCRNSRFSSHPPILASLRRGKISLRFSTGTPFACRIASSNRTQSHGALVGLRQPLTLRSFFLLPLSTSASTQSRFLGLFPKLW